MGLSLGCRASLVLAASEHSRITFVSLTVSSISCQLDTGQLLLYLELSPVNHGYWLESSSGCRTDSVQALPYYLHPTYNSLSTYENNCKYKKNIFAKTQSITAKKTLAYQKQNYSLTIELLHSTISDVNNSQRKIYSCGRSVIAVSYTHLTLPTNREV